MNGDYLERALSLLEKEGAALRDRRVVLGFDGFVDHIVSPIRKGDGTKVEQLYSTIEQFSDFLSERSGKSCSIELQEFESRIGGNAPICASAFGTFGVNVTCIGAFGHPDIHEVFRRLPANCQVVSIENPGVCIALEFQDGKVMMAMNKGINAIDWRTVTDRVGLDNIKDWISASDLLGLMNWSEMPGATSIWKGILQEASPLGETDKWALFDLADCERRSDADCLEVLQIISDYGKRFKTVLCLNENEARHISRLILDGGDAPLEQVGAKLQERLGIHAVVFHFTDRSMAFQSSAIWKYQSFLIEHPVITTGAGDHFNAGLSSGLLCGMEFGAALSIASSTASYFVANGHSPSINQLIGFMTDQTNETRRG